MLFPYSKTLCKIIFSVTYRYCNISVSQKSVFWTLLQTALETVITIIFSITYRYCNISVSQKSVFWTLLQTALETVITILCLSRYILISELFCLTTEYANCFYMDLACHCFTSAHYENTGSFYIKVFGFYLS